MAFALKVAGFIRCSYKAFEELWGRSCEQANKGFDGTGFTVYVGANPGAGGFLR